MDFIKLANSSLKAKENCLKGRGGVEIYENPGLIITEKANSIYSN